jgi:hypothetical protein
MVEEADGHAIRGAQPRSNRRNPGQEPVHGNGNEVMTVSNEHDFSGIGGSLTGQLRWRPPFGRLALVIERKAPGGEVVTTGGV